MKDEKITKLIFTIADKSSDIEVLRNLDGLVTELLQWSDGEDGKKLISPKVSVELSNFIYGKLRRAEGDESEYPEAFRKMIIEELGDL